MTFLEFLILISLWAASTYLVNRKGAFLGSFFSVILIFFTLITYYTAIIFINKEYEPIIVIAVLYFSVILSVIIIPLALISNYLIRFLMSLNDQEF